MNRTDRLKIKAVTNFLTVTFMAITFGCSNDSALTGVAVFLAWLMGMSVQNIMSEVKRGDKHGSKKE